MLKDMEKIIKFTLDMHNIRATWSVIPLTYHNWKKLSIEKTHLDTLASTQQKQIMERLKGLPEVDKELKKRIYEILEMETEIEKEYGRTLTLEDNLNSCSIQLEVKPFERLFRHTNMRRNLPFYYKLFKKNKDKDFLILLNMPLTSKDSRREKMKTVVHEALHFIQNLKETRTNLKTIENEADRIVDEFLKQMES